MKIKLLGTLMITFGVFLFAGVVSASDTETLQPAADITYNENVTINGTARVNSIYVGEEGVGGVTFFNGSIVNIGATTPITIADDLRVDGEIWRGSKGGDPIKISDNVIPTLTNTNDFGQSTNRWKNIYAMNGNYSNNLIVSQNVTAKNFNYSSAKIRYYSISPWEFVPSADYTTFVKSSQSLTGNGDLIVPVHLPNGSIIKKFEFEYLDNGSGSLWCDLRAENNFGGLSSTNITHFMSTTNSSTARKVIKNVNHTVNNVSNNYFVIVNFTGSGPLQMKPILITYEINKPLP